jgi:hypothetical protein
MATADIARYPGIDIDGVVHSFHTEQIRKVAFSVAGLVAMIVMLLSVVALQFAANRAPGQSAPDVRPAPGLEPPSGRPAGDKYFDGVEPM